MRDRPTPAISVEEAMKLALARRPELLASDASIARNDIDRRYFENQALPQVNLIGGYTLRGLSGASLPVTSDPLSGSDAVFFARLNELAVLAGLTPLDPPQSTTSTVPGFFVGGAGTSLGNLFDRRFQTALIQIQLEIPLRNRTAQANVARAGIQRAAARTPAPSARTDHRSRGAQHAAGRAIVRAPPGRRRVSPAQRA